MSSEFSYQELYSSWFDFLISTYWNSGLDGDNRYKSPEEYILFHLDYYRDGFSPELKHLKRVLQNLLILFRKNTYSENSRVVMIPLNIIKKIKNEIPNN